MMKGYSITRRLIVTVLLIELTCALCVTAVAWVYERHMHFRSFDVLLRGRADSMLGAVQDADDAADNVMLDGSQLTVPAEDVYEVDDANGRVLGRSTNWAGASSIAQKEKDKADQHASDAAHPHDESFFKVKANGKSFRVIRLQGLRIVDPGEKSGGVWRFVTIYYGAPVGRVWSAVYRVVSFYALSSLVLLALTGLLMSWLLNRSLAPLRLLAASAGRVSVTSWEFEAPESARQIQELNPLVAAMEELLRGLRGAFEKQRRFTGDAAHELKTGVAVIKSSLQLLQMKKRTTEEYEAGLERCLGDCERIEQIVAQMLTLARVEESADVARSAYKTNVSASIRDIHEQLRTKAELNDVVVQILSADDLNVPVNPELFNLMLTNVLMNALQHSPAGSVVRMEAQRAGGSAEIRITDEGEGISPEQLPYIFERFSRSDPSRSRRTGGTGLGLAICKGIADSFHGSIDVQSELNQGTTVTIQFPLTTQYAEAVP